MDYIGEAWDLENLAEEADAEVLRHQELARLAERRAERLRRESKQVLKKVHAIKVGDIVNVNTPRKTDCHSDYRYPYLGVVVGRVNPGKVSVAPLARYRLFGANAHPYMEFDSWCHKGVHL